MASASTSSWSSIPDDQLTIQKARDILTSADSDAWAIAASADLVLPDPVIQSEIVRIGLARSEDTVQRAREVLNAQGEGEEGLRGWLGANEAERVVLRLRRVSLDRSDRLRTWGQMVQVGRWDTSSPVPAAAAPAASGKEEAGAGASEEEEDAWGGEDDAGDAWDDPDANLTLSTDPGLADLTLTTDPRSSTPVPPTTSSAPSTSTPQPPSGPLTLKDFLLLPLLHSALLLASSAQYLPLQALLHRHSAQLWPYRFSILAQIPEWENIDRYQGLLPGYDWRTERESLPSASPWRPEPDFVELPSVSSALSLPPEPVYPGLEPRPDPLSGQELSEWYAARVRAIDSSSGALDQALALVQHAAGLGVPALDALGEDLSLLSKMVYDAPTPPSGLPADYTLSDWERMPPSEVVRAYLAGSTPTSIARDIKTLVLPYLYVLEARSERSGQPDPSLITREIYSYLLTSPLDHALALFEASKPTLRPDQRIVRSDEDVARLALAYLYGSAYVSQEEWGKMSRIFECLPAWPNVTGREERDEAEATLSALAAFVTPSTSATPGPEELLLFFQPLPRSALTHLLDVLDLHLESGEILARWSCPAPLRWFLQSKDDKPAQRQWATRMARGVARMLGGEGGEGEWRNLWEDMEKLAGDSDAAADTPSSEDDEEEEEDAWGAVSGERDKPLRPAFGLLGKEEVARIFFGGLLSSGNFKLAKKMLMPPNSREPWPLSREAIEDLVLAASREFYDNADSGNLHSGDMRLAYECLNVAPPSPAIVKERAFIEATSRLCSYNLTSRSGNPISPIEIRLTKDKLSLIARLLSSTEDMYKHTEVVLSLVDKLGFAGDEVAQIKALGMIATTALQSEDFASAAGTAESMLAKTFELRVADPEGARDVKSGTFEAVTVCWQVCFQLGGQEEYRDPVRKMALLSNALKLCPAENIPDVLAAWRRVEAEVEALPLDQAVLSTTPHSADSSSKHSYSSSLHASTDLLHKALHTRSHLLPTLGNLGNLGDLHLPSASQLMNQPTAAIAARTFGRVVGAAGANFFPPRARAGSVMSDDSESARSVRSGSPDLGKQARSVFTRGVGWLIGADEEGVQ